MTDLKQEIKKALDEIQLQINHMHLESVVNRNLPSYHIYKLVDANGNYLLAPLLTAKATLLSALANLELLEPEDKTNES